LTPAKRSTDAGLRTRLRGLKHLHDEFLRECRALGVGFPSICHF
jgi:hypothetical protein